MEIRRLIWTLIALLTISWSSFPSFAFAEQEAGFEDIKIQLDETQAELNALYQELSETEAELQKITTDLATEQERLAQLEIELDQKIRILNLRVVSLYKSGNRDLLSVLFDSEDINDLLHRLAMMRRLAEHDAQIIQEIKAAREEILTGRERVEARKEELEAKRNQLTELTAMTESKKEQIRNLYYEKGGWIQDQGNLDTTSEGWGESFADVSDWTSTSGLTASGGIVTIQGEAGSILTQSIELPNSYSLANYPYLSIRIKASRGNTYHIRPLGVDGNGSAVSISSSNSPSENRGGTGEWELMTWNLRTMAKGRAVAFRGVTIVAEGSGSAIQVQIDWIRLHQGLTPRQCQQVETDFLNQIDDDCDGYTDKDDPDYSPPRQVLALYHIWYGSRYGPTGKWFHWNHNGYNPDRVVDGRRHIPSPDYPLIPPEKYDSQDVEVLRQHVEWAIASGIDGFMVDWWGIGHFEDNATKLLVELIEKDYPRFRIAILYDGHYGRDYKSAEAMGRDFDYILKTYGNRNSYFRIDGKPVIMIWSAKSHRANEWIRAFNSTDKPRSQVVYLVDKRDYISFADGYSTYTNDATAYLLRTDDTKIFSETVQPGWNNTKITKPGAIVPRNNGAWYSELWEKAIHKNPDFILICSWNEWHEGSEIEPSREYGTLYLELTEKYSKIYKSQ